MNKIVPSGLKMLLFGVCLFFGSVNCFAQNPTQKSDFWNKVRFGGGIGFNFSNGGFNGSIAPSAIYQFNDYIAAGIGANVNFFKFNNQKFWAYGPSAVVLGNPIPQIQLSAEFEQLRINSSIQTIGGTLERDFWSPALFIGAGYRTNFATVGIRYNLLYDNVDSIYLNAWTPFVRVYF
ncbi:alpha-ketoglutarate decarboxylase [Maribacter algarum]|uniref:Alpha-ketoglutarate decarboxylase n=1 Tax=Maribacter algarum (ex Zhang et al. 2020) TaxID=2578118 RepID=A0A5S3PTQ0_9FLAO|nr:alpha-ketoglutarate decarboxylase [Maribacter algarum]TMM58343.1 alpha-ketoglutarate decarboxylase [Maribacter algarum]